MAATYKDIQRVTGLSLATISKYYNGRTVLEANGVAIADAAKRLGFRPNGFARNLRSRRSRTIGVLLPALDNEFHLSIIAGVEGALRSAGMSVLVSSSPDAEAAAVELLMSRMVDGIIAVPSPHDVVPLGLAAERLPVVQIDWAAVGLETDGVFLDNREAGRAAARHLLDHGHRRIAMVGGDRAVSTMRERADGFVEELAAADVEPGTVLAGPLTVDAGREGLARLLADRSRPTAVFAANAELTLGALIAAHESGLRLGRELSLLGFDALDLARATQPRLTVITQPTHDIAARAAALVRARLEEGGGPPTAVLLPPTLVPGHSVARIDA